MAKKQAKIVLYVEQKQETDRDRLQRVYNSTLGRMEVYNEPIRLFLATGKTTVKVPTLPTELMHIILQYLPPGLKDVKNKRFITRQWRDFGEEFFKTESAIRPLKNDYRLLTGIADHKPEFLDRVRTLTFEIGKINSRLVPEKVGHFLHKSGMRMREVQGVVLEYAEYNYAHLQDNEYMARLRDVLLYHNKLERVKIKRYQYSFKSGTLSEIFEGYWSYKARSSSLEMNAEFLSILQAMYSISTTSPQSGSPTIKHLSHESLSPSLFGYLFSHDAPKLSVLTLPFQHLETLHLNFEGIGKPPLKCFWKGLAIVLQNATNLKTLRFGFDPTLTERFQSSDWTKHDRSDTRDAWYVALHLLDFGISATLETLRLDGLLVCQRGLQHFLPNYPALKELQLCQIRLRTGSFPSLANFVRNELSLSKFQLWGRLCSASIAWAISGQDVGLDGLVVDEKYFPEGNYPTYNADILTADDQLWLQPDNAASLMEWDPTRLSNWREYDSILGWQDPNLTHGQRLGWIPADIFPCFDVQGRDSNGVHYTEYSDETKRIIKLYLRNVLGGGRGLDYEITRLQTRDSILVELDELHQKNDPEGKQVMQCWDHSEHPLSEELLEQVLA
ncbi:hypothetical protein ACEPPN_005322 [Leptodophora sp. 'Broadleaf-Isolate-01']